MRNRFRYTPQRLSNTLTYAVVVSVSLVAIALWGHAFWTTLVDRFGGAGTFVGLGFLFYFGWFWLLGGFYMLLDRYEAPRFLYRYKIQERDAGKRRPAPSLRHAVKLVLFNQILGTLPVLLFAYWLLLLRGMDHAAPPPPWWMNLAHLVGIVLCAEVVFYTVHRALHRKFLFKHVHRVHHECRETFGIATHYVHYVEHLIGNLPTIFVGLVLINPHPLVALLWIWISVTNAIHTHSGYNFPFMTWAVDHDFHHYNTHGNYGSLGLLDRLFGTDAQMRRLDPAGRGPN